MKNPKIIYQVNHYKAQGAGDVIDRVEFFYHIHNANEAVARSAYFAVVKEIYPVDHNYCWHKHENGSVGA